MPDVVVTHTPYSSGKTELLAWLNNRINSVEPRLYPELRTTKHGRGQGNPHHSAQLGTRSKTGQTPSSLPGRLLTCSKHGNVLPKSFLLENGNIHNF